ncbi:hypothetical protein IAR50_001705 [Cryptococcus sp. DSM 104548]
MDSHRGHGEPELLPSPTTSPTYSNFTSTSVSVSIAALVPSAAEQSDSEGERKVKATAQTTKYGKSTLPAPRTHVPPSRTAAFPDSKPHPTLSPIPQEQVSPTLSNPSSESTTSFAVDLEKNPDLAPVRQERKKKFSFSLKKKGVKDILPARLYSERHNSVTLIHITAFGTAFVVAGLLGGLFYWMVNKDNNENVQ